MLQKTRDKLIDVARQLFARKGVENTTMNDIAAASEKGRRTIYTYFKSKHDIYKAVVETESAHLFRRLQELMSKPMTPEEKLENYIFIRFEAMKEIVLRNGTLKAGFFRDIRKVERARRVIDNREVEILRQIIQEGVDKGVFDVNHPRETAEVMHLALRGLDVPFIRDSFSELDIEKDRLKEYIMNFILYGIKK